MEGNEAYHPSPWTSSVTIAPSQPGPLEPLPSPLLFPIYSSLTARIPLPPHPLFLLPSPISLTSLFILEHSFLFFPPPLSLVNPHPPNPSILPPLPVWTAPDLWGATPFLSSQTSLPVPSWTSISLVLLCCHGGGAGAAQAGCPE